MQKDPVKTAVIFRKYPNGNIIALFTQKDITIPVIAQQRNKSPSLQDYSQIIMKTIPAKENEYIELYQELINQGYSLQVIRKRTKR